ncbi:MAG: hypothetical protein K2P73_01515 [Lachnospiraceae bacterium]|nr:hypothetical protein [Lachnospiraceae bacterium]
MGRQFTQSAMQTMTGHSSNPISRRAFESSVKKGGDFANGVNRDCGQRKHQLHRLHDRHTGSTGAYLLPGADRHP